MNALMTLKALYILLNTLNKLEGKTHELNETKEA